MSVRKPAAYERQLNAVSRRWVASFSLLVRNDRRCRMVAMSGPEQQHTHTLEPPARHDHTDGVAEQPYVNAADAGVRCP